MPAAPMFNKTAAIQQVSEGLLRLSGVIDAVTAVALQPQGQALLSKQTGAQCLIDLAAVEHGGSVAVALLTTWKRFAAKHNKTLVFQNIPTVMLAMARLSGIEDILVTNA